MKKTDRNYSRLFKDSKEKELTHSEKLIMFFFGIIIILITGTRVFYHLPGNETQKRQTLFYYLSGIVFWILVIGLTVYLIDK